MGLLQNNQKKTFRTFFLNKSTFPKPNPFRPKLFDSTRLAWNVLSPSKTPSRHPRPGLEAKKTGPVRSSGDSATVGFLVPFFWKALKRACLGLFVHSFLCFSIFLEAPKKIGFLFEVLCLHQNSVCFWVIMEGARMIACRDLCHAQDLLR